MEFEFDPQKSAANKVKHGIDCRRAGAVAGRYADRSAGEDGRRTAVSRRRPNRRPPLVGGLRSARLYLRDLTRKAQAGQFTLVPMLMALIGRREREKKRA